MSTPREPDRPSRWRPPQRDPEAMAAARRTQEVYLRDIGDQEGIDQMHLPRPPRRRRPLLWLFLLVLALVAVAGYKSFQGGTNVPIHKNCHTPGIEVTSGKAAGNASVPWSATGPNDTRYLLAIGGGTVTSGGTAVAGGEVGAAAFTMKSCLAHGAFKAPEKLGKYDVRLMEAAGTGWKQVAKYRLEVVK
jgi:hypothetical protein